MQASERQMVQATMIMRLHWGADRADARMCEEVRNAHAGGIVLCTAKAEPSKHTPFIPVPLPAGAGTVTPAGKAEWCWFP